MSVRFRLVMGLSLIVIAAGSTSAGAATITYNLTGNPANLINVALPPGDSFAEEVLFLTDADTGSSVIPGTMVSPGDVINANITLSTSLTVPPGSSVQLELQSLPDGGGFGFTESVSYFLGGTQLSQPPGLVNTVASGPALGLGQLPQLPGDHPSFSFDAADLSATLNDITESGNPVSSATLEPASPALILLYPTPVPLPAGFELLLSGLAGFGALAIRRQKGTPPHGNAG
jgi:hypothetical protein